MEPLNSLTPVDTSSIKYNLIERDASNKIKNYFICKSIDRIVEEYKSYTPTFFWSKRKTLMEWGKSKVFYGIDMTNIVWYMTSNNYDHFLKDMAMSVSFSKNDVVYLSDEYVRKYSNVLNILNNFDSKKVEKYKTEYKELWEYLDR